MGLARGIIVSTPIVAQRERFRLLLDPLDSQELRYWLLFFDKLNFPELKGFHIGLGSEGDFLESVGLLKRHPISDWRIRMSGIPGVDRQEDRYQFYIMQAFRELEVLEPGVWAIATGEGSLMLDADEWGDGRGVLFTLHRALPVPSKDVPLAELLEFKEKRRSELLDLQFHLDEVYSRISASPDQTHALNSELGALDRAVSNYVRVGRVSSIRKWIETNISAEIRLRHGVNVGLLAHIVDLPLATAVGLGAAASIDIRASFGLKDFHRSSSTPWRYVASYLNEVFHE